MANQNDNPTVDDLDLSGIEGFSDDVTVDETPIESPELQETQTTEPQSSDDGPISWSSVEKLVPEPLHEELKPLVDEWRRQYERVLDETSPYRQYSERGVSQRDIDMALNIQQALLQNPKRFYDGMGETYGWNQQQQNQQMPPVPQQQTQEYDLFAAESPATADPMLLQQIQAQQARLDQIEQAQMFAYQQQAEQQQMAVGRQQLDQELSQLESKYGSFDKAEVVKRAIANASAGADPSVTKAFHELKDYEDRLRKSFVSNRPPKVMGSGTATAPQPPADLSSEEAKRDAALQLAIRLGATAPGDFVR